MSILRMVGIMLVAMQANKSAKFIIQQQADTDDNADSEDDFYDDVIAQSALNWMEKIDGRIRRHRMQFMKLSHA